MKLTPYQLAKLKSEIKEIEEALEKTGGRKGDAAKLLQIDRKTIYNKQKIYKKWMESQSKKRAFPKAEAP